MSTIVDSFCLGIVISSICGKWPFEKNVDIPATSRESLTQRLCANADPFPHIRYWNWALWADDLASSPLFDCSDTSLSGDGEYNSDEQPSEVPPGWVTVPRGTGGGCTRCGPFKDMEIHLGPFSHDFDAPGPPPPPQFEYNPRCLNRSLNTYVSSTYTNATVIEDLIMTDSIADFQLVLDHNPFVMNGSLGIHGGGHWSLGATHSDLFASPQDPAFMLHHSMIDRLWAEWQAMDEPNRRYALNGTDGFLNPPTSTVVTPDTMMEFEVLDRPRPIREVMDPKGHQYCYMYT
ncbi:N-acetyl-6-hydroxytryptophan oxidase ivoB [Penicillium chermesinum]|nr:N-acetyl-6-hydroxytryptophan oxidase ivoB [Penicillium chermesinum]